MGKEGIDILKIDVQALIKMLNDLYKRFEEVDELHEDYLQRKK